MRQGELHDVRLGNQRSLTPEASGTLATPSLTDAYACAHPGRIRRRWPRVREGSIEKRPSHSARRQLQSVLEQTGTARAWTHWTLARRVAAQWPGRHPPARILGQTPSAVATLLTPPIRSRGPQLGTKQLMADIEQRSSPTVTSSLGRAVPVAADDGNVPNLRASSTRRPPGS